MSYEIGYRRPPKSGQFVKGTTGNPKGRPKGSKNFLTLLEKELAEPIVVNENGRKKKISRMQAMVKRMVAGALQGEQKSLVTLVEILKKTGRFEEGASESLLPDNYASLLETYVEQRSQKSGPTPVARTTKTKSEK